MARRSIGRKIAALVFALTLVIVALFTFHFARFQHIDAREDLDRKAATYARVLAIELKPAVGSDDRDEARAALDAVLVDQDVLGLALFDESDRLVVAAGAPVDVNDPSVERVAVASHEGRRGTLRIQMSTAPMAAEPARVVRDAIILGIAALAVSLIVARLIGRSIAARLETLATQTAGVTRGNLDVAIVLDSGTDEISDLTRTFAAMVDRIRALVADVDARVARRTSELDARTDAMRSLLDNVGDAIFTIDRQGVVGAERSLPADLLFGMPATDMHARAWLETIDPRAAAWLEIGLSAVWEEVLPLEMTLDQLPATMTNGQRHFALHYTPIHEGTLLVSLLVVVSDVTSAVEQRRVEYVQRDVVSALRHAVDDRSGFEDLVAESRKLLGVVTSSKDMPEVKRALHTLKGNFATFELQTMCAQAHDLETLMIERERLPCADDMASLRAAWALVDGATESVLAPLRNRIAVPDSVLVSLAYDAQCAGAVDLAARIRELRGQTVHTRLLRLAEHARTVASRLGKPGLVVTCTCDDTRLPPEPWLPFWSALVHSIRNAIDHGVELPDERERAGKSPHGAITLRAESERHRYVVEVTDDGRGIDWEVVRASAAKVGIAAVTPQELEDVLFLEGVTTRDSATDISGRGLGMGTMRAACEALGGRVTVSSTKNGTTVRFEFPPADVSSRGGARAA